MSTFAYINYAKSSYGKPNPQNYAPAGGYTRRRCSWPMSELVDESEALGVKHQ